MAFTYLQKNQFEIVREAGAAEYVFPLLNSGETVVLDADVLTHHVYYEVRDTAEAKAAVADSLDRTRSQRFYVVRRVS